MTKKLVSLVAVFIAVCLAAVFGYNRHLDSQRLEAVSAQIRETAPMAGRIIDMDKQFKGATYQEVIATLAGYVTEVDKKTLAVEALSDPRVKGEIDVALAYMRAAQGAIRARESAVRSEVELRSALKYATYILERTYGDRQLDPGARLAKMKFNDAEERHRDDLRELAATLDHLADTMPQVSIAFGFSPGDPDAVRKQAEQARKMLQEIASEPRLR